MSERDQFSWLRKNAGWIVAFVTLLGAAGQAYNTLENEVIRLQAAYTGVTQQLTHFVRELREHHERK